MISYIAFRKSLFFLLESFLAFLWSRVDKKWLEDIFEGMLPEIGAEVPEGITEPVCVIGRVIFHEGLWKLTYILSHKVSVFAFFHNLATTCGPTLLIVHVFNILKQ